MKWRIYYSDSSTIDDTYSGGAFEVPALGVIAITKIDSDVGRTILSGCHYYIYRENYRQWFGINKSDHFAVGLIDYLIQPGPKKVIFGRTVPHDEFDAIIKRALSDPDFPPKTARSPDEDF